MPLELLQQESKIYMAAIDKSDASIREFTGSGITDMSFGNITLDAGTGTVSIEGATGSFELSAQPDADVQAVVLDKQTGEVLHERAIAL